MSAETKEDVRIGDVVLAKKRDAGEEFFAFGEYDNEDSLWSYNEEPIGNAVVWSSDYRFGTSEYTRPEYFWADVFLKTFGYAYQDYPTTVEEEVKYIQQAQRLARMMLKTGKFEIISHTEFFARGYKSGLISPDYAAYYLIIKGRRDSYMHRGVLEKFANWFYYLTTSNVDYFTKEDAEMIFYIVNDLETRDLAAIAEQFEDFAFKPIYVCNSLTIKIEDKGFRWDRPDGYFYCYKEDALKYFSSDDWKKSYYDYVEGIVDEFNCLARGESYWFCSAKVEDIKNAYFDILEDLFARVRRLATNGHTYAEDLANVFTGELLSLKEYVFESKDDSCGGYYGEDYTEVLKHYLDEQGMDFICVVKRNVQEK